MSRCALCLEERPVCISHIVPAFVGRYLKVTSATGFLRGAVNPNVRQQDVTKEPLLCGECEQRFGVCEREFSLNAFPKIRDDNFTDLPYGPALLKFAVSLSWRVLVSECSNVLSEVPQFTNQVNKTLEDWRVFLLGRKNRVDSEHHLFVFAGIPESVPPGMHPKILHYLLRCIDATPVVGKRTMAVYVKLMRAMFYSPIAPASPRGWMNTRIHNGHARLTAPQRIDMPGFGDFLNSRVQEAFAKPLSQNQIDKIKQAMLKNPERALSSESYRVHLATRRLVVAMKEGKEG